MAGSSDDWGENDNHSRKGIPRLVQLKSNVRKFCPQASFRTSQRFQAALKVRFPVT